MWNSMFQNSKRFFSQLNGILLSLLLLLQHHVRHAWVNPTVKRNVLKLSFYTFSKHVCFRLTIILIIHFVWVSSHVAHNVSYMLSLLWEEISKWCYCSSGITCTHFLTMLQIRKERSIHLNQNNNGKNIKTYITRLELPYSVFSHKITSHNTTTKYGIKLSSFIIIISPSLTNSHIT